MGNFNSIVFPAPKSSYTEEIFNDPQKSDNVIKFISEDCIIHVPSRNVERPNLNHTVPCLFMPHYDENEENSTKQFMLYFHGNAEDIGRAYDFASDLRSLLHINVIMMEYAGYGTYTSVQSSAEQIAADALSVYEYVRRITEEQHILVFGRSMGSGSACNIASDFSPAGLILMSAYTSIKGVAEGLVGQFLAKVVNDRFRNIDAMDKVKCPVLLIHGVQDRLIPHTQSEQLAQRVKHQKVRRVYPPQMTHNDFNMQFDIIDSIQTFMREDLNLLFKDKTLFPIPREHIDKHLVWWKNQEEKKHAQKVQINNQLKQQQQQQQQQQLLQQPPQLPPQHAPSHSHFSDDRTTHKMHLSGKLEKKEVQEETKFSGDTDFDTKQ